VKNAALPKLNEKAARITDIMNILKSGSDYTKRVPKLISTHGKSNGFSLIALR
jgi:hypothetical protein